MTGQRQRRLGDYELLWHMHRQPVPYGATAKGAAVIGQPVPF